MTGLAYDMAKALKQQLEIDVKLTSLPLSSFPKTENGLTPDHIKASSEWRDAKSAYDAAFQRQRGFNAWFTQAFKTEIRAERRAS